MSRDEKIAELMTVFIHFKRHMRKHLQHDLADGITMAQVELLVAIQNGHSRLKDIACIAYMTPSAVTQQFKLLEAAGYVEQQISEHDRRERTLNLTTKGDEYLKKRRKIVHMHFARYLENLDEKEIEEFIRLMKKMIER